MTTLTLETEPLAAQVRVTDEKLIVDSIDGRSLINKLGFIKSKGHFSIVKQLAPRSGANCLNQ